MNVIDSALNADHEHGTFVYAIALIAALNGLLFGFDIGVISGALLYINETFTLTPFLEGVVTSSMLIGAMIGAAIGGRLSDRFGRRRVTFAGAIVFFCRFIRDGSLADARLAHRLASDRRYCRWRRIDGWAVVDR